MTLDQLVKTGRIVDDLIVQSGYTKYDEDSFKEIFDFTTNIDFYIDSADLVISADGAGTIFNILDKGKKVIVVDNKLASKYGAPANDFVGGLEKEGYLLWCKNVSDIFSYIELAKSTDFPRYTSPGNKIYETIIKSFEKWQSHHNKY